MALRRLAYVAAAVALVTLGIISAVVTFPLRRASSEAPAVASDASRFLLAVLPFAIDATDPVEGAYWAGLTQIVSTRLAGLAPEHRLYVAAASDVIQRRVTTPQEARLELGATRAIRVRATLTAEPARTTLELVDTRQQKTIAQADVPINRRNPAAFQNEIIAAILKLLDISLTADERARILVPQTAPGASDLYLQAIGYIDGYFRDGNIDNAIELLQQALEPRSQLRGRPRGAGPRVLAQVRTDKRRARR